MIEIPIAGAALKELKRHEDGRGFFEEIIRASDPFFHGFAQFSWCRRATGVITAWHFHPSQWDWWFVPHGRIRAVLHDLREDSPTRRATFEIELGEGTPDRVLAIPNGVAHGYKVLAGPMELFYLTSVEYDREHLAPPIGQEGRIPYDDPTIGYDWNAREEMRSRP